MIDNTVKIAFVDFETTANKGDFWGDKWQTSIIKVTEYTKMLSFSWKWSKGEHITKGWRDYPGYVKNKDNELRMLKEVWNLFNEADIIVAHNGRDFDFKVANSRFAAHDMTPPSPYKIVDTKIEAKKYIRIPSYSLNEIAAYFGIGTKITHEGYPLWEECKAGKDAAWKKMLAYNRHDVILLERVYLKLLPWMRSHPNIGMFTGKLVCPTCGADALVGEGTVRNKTTEYQQYSCKKCGSWGRDTKNIRVIKPIVSI